MMLYQLTRTLSFSNKSNVVEMFLICLPKASKEWKMIFSFFFLWWAHSMNTCLLVSVVSPTYVRDSKVYVRRKFTKHNMFIFYNHSKNVYNFCINVRCIPRINELSFPCMYLPFNTPCNTNTYCAQSFTKKHYIYTYLNSDLTFHYINFLQFLFFCKWLDYWQNGRQIKFIFLQQNSRYSCSISFSLTKIIKSFLEIIFN
jgi:hypothetical protein